VVARAPAFEPLALSGTFAARAGATPYVRLGDAPLFAALIALVMAVVLHARRRPALSRY
jgi:apolipoprotein N-acyltransferase